MNPPKHSYFFDLALSDINAIACSASRLLFHGSTHGAFGSFGHRKPEASVDLSAVDAISVKLEHLSNFPLSDEFDYKILYLRRHCYDSLWKGSYRTKVKGLKDLACIARLSPKAALTPKTQRVFLVSVSNRPVAIAPYDYDISCCHYLPDEYCATLKHEFKAILVRTKKANTAKFNLLLSAHGLKTTSVREATDGYDGNLTVRCYSSTSQRATCLAK